MTVEQQATQFNKQNKKRLLALQFDVRIYARFEINHLAQMLHMLTLVKT